MFERNLTIYFMLMSCLLHVSLLFYQCISLNSISSAGHFLFFFNASSVPISCCTVFNAAKMIDTHKKGFCCVALKQVIITSENNVSEVLKYYENNL